MYKVKVSCISLMQTLVLFLQLTDEQKRWLDVLRLKGSEKKRQEDTDAPANPIRRYTREEERNEKSMREMFTLPFLAG